MYIFYNFCKDFLPLTIKNSFSMEVADVIALLENLSLHHYIRNNINNVPLDNIFGYLFEIQKYYNNYGRFIIN